MSIPESSEPDMRRALQSAWQHVHDGDLMEARMVCGAAIAVHQPALEQDAALLLDTVTVLAAARGLRAIERLLSAVSGRSVRVSIGAMSATEACSPGRSVERHAVSEACLDDPWLLRQWCEQLLRSSSAS